MNEIIMIEYAPCQGFARDSTSVLPEANVCMSPRTIASEKQPVRVQVRVQSDRGG
jgi:hypothetical protein